MVTSIHCLQFFFYNDRDFLCLLLMNYKWVWQIFSYTIHTAQICVFISWSGVFWIRLSNSSTKLSTVHGFGRDCEWKVKRSEKQVGSRPTFPNPDLICKEGHRFISSWRCQVLFFIIMLFFNQCFLVLSLDISQPEIMLNKSKLQTGKVCLLLSHFVCRHATLLPKIGSQKERCVTTKKWLRTGLGRVVLKK